MTSAERKADEMLGPYMNENGDWWVPTRVSYQTAVSLIRECLDEHNSRLVFKGVQTVDNHAHEADVWVESVCIGSGCRKNVDCWHFFEEVT